MTYFSITNLFVPTFNNSFNLLTIKIGKLALFYGPFHLFNKIYLRLIP